MNEQECLTKMMAPGQVRPCKPYRGGVIQIWVTRACDKCCFGCTQGANLAANPDVSTQRFITVKQFRTSCESLRDYWGVVGMLGGNPCLHPQFQELCEVMRDVIPKEQCGLWSNRLFDHGPTCQMTFNPSYSNLNVHLDAAAHNEIKRDWPEALPVGLHDDSRHGPPLVAMQDIIEDDSERWGLISNCDINQRWSAGLGVFRGELRAWFCEIAMAQSLIHQHESDYPDTGLPVESGWWKRPMQDFVEQVRFHCHACGVPLRGKGELSQSREGTEQVSKTHLPIFKSKQRGRQVQLVTTLEELGSRLSVFTNYIQNGRTRGCE